MQGNQGVGRELEKGTQYNIQGRKRRKIREKAEKVGTEGAVGGKGSCKMRGRMREKGKGIADCKKGRNKELEVGMNS